MNKSFRFFLFSAPLFALPPCAALAAAISIPFTYERNIPFVAVQATNSPPMCFILDTGAPTTIVGSTTSERLKLGFYKSPRPGNDLATATTCGMGNAPADFLQGLRATCGGLPLRSTALRTDITNMSIGCGRPVDGLLGTDFLRNKILTIHFPSRTLRVEPAPGLDNVFNRITDNIPVDQRNAVFVKISAPASPRPLVFLVDTGTTHCVLDLQAAKRMNLPLGAGRDMNVVGGTKVAYAANHFVGRCDGRPLPSQIFAVDLSEASWSLTRRIDGILGMDFMENYTVKLNFNTHQMQLLPSRAADPDIAAR